MGKDEFLRKLEMLLSDISAEEREEAMAFYRSYFEDAGEGNEAGVIAELESPEKVAEIIKRDLGMVSVGNQAQGGKEQNEKEQSGKAQSGKEQNHTWIIILVIVIGLFSSPAWLGILGTVIGLAAALISVTVAMFATGAVFIGVGVTMIAGISVPAGLAFIGVGLFILAIAILLLLACVGVFGKFLPWACKSICHLCKKPFEKKGAQTV